MYKISICNRMGLHSLELGSGKIITTRSINNNIIDLATLDQLSQLISTLYIDTNILFKYKLRAYLHRQCNHP